MRFFFLPPVHWPTIRPAMHEENARALLRLMLGPGTEFRDGQWAAIDLAANQRERLLVVQRTGWGKSIVYFLATKILRDAGAGPTLLISPLLSLMRNQILMAAKLGLRPATIHSENLKEWSQVEAGLAANEVDLLMVSPERLGSPGFLRKLLPLIQGAIGMFVVDEAHCISDWGHDFRPDYRRIVRILRLLPPKIPVLCTTATANDRVVRDIETQIPNLRVLRGPLVRHSLRLYNLKIDDQAERLAWLAHVLPQLQGNGIIYTLTVQDAHRVAQWLQSRGLNVRPYHADLEAVERIETENRLLHNQVKALAATVALGMGFDKPDLGFVIHFQRPGSVVAYYQQVGRAGRAVDSAYGILLSGREDDEIQKYFIDTAFPPLEVTQAVLKALEKAGVLTTEQLGAELNYAWGTIEKVLKLLEVEGLVERDTAGFVRTPNPWRPDTERVDRVMQVRQAELEQIKRYVEHPGCLMEFLARALDDPSARPCGKCMNCAGKNQRKAVPAELVQAAIDFLRQDTLILQPRERWPRPVLTDLEKVMPEVFERFDNDRPKAAIPERLRAREGRALCSYGDAGWGQQVAHGKYASGRFSEALVKAAAELIQSKWRPDPPPQWVTAIPSQRHPALVLHLAKDLAARLGLPFLAALSRRPGSRPEQKQMQNSSTQLRNLLSGFEVVAVANWPLAGGTEQRVPAPGLIARLLQTLTLTARPTVRLPPAPVLLVDDVVDSGWTLAWAAVLLQQYGSGPVYPFALAKASPRGG